MALPTWIATLRCWLRGHHDVGMLGQWSTTGRLIHIPCCLSCGAML